ncbi:hypothetical protein PGT21_016089 [Puccinia graminis f. sp. tritici]|uniref:Uncharacterized protein n=1 Tax=Puccinia graminis f. sp. tritici TaxID=56615 RepID=A0A5B0MXP6_PUCGR|nr:hypothetical protein PGT21_016089 [Puccinia graminis f. sp. tritici]KAA1131618.1 hypothetical protein PGTUg99_033470 [Puccinia graminis f. sp. tritici]
MITGYPTVDHLRMHSGLLMWVCFGFQRSPDAAGSISGAILQNCALTTLPPCSVTGASRTTPYGVLLTLSLPGRVGSLNSTSCHVSEGKKKALGVTPDEPA